MAGGTVLRLEGARFGARAAELVGVTLGGLPCRTLTWDGSDAIGCTTPNLAGADGASSGSIDVRVVVGVPALPGSGAANRSIASNVAKLSVPLPPRLSSVVPASGPRAGGTRVTVHGSALGRDSGDLKSINFASDVGAWRCTSLRFISSREVRCTTPPAEAGSAAVSVTTGVGGNSSLLALPEGDSGVHFAFVPFDTGAADGAPPAANLARGASLNVSSTCCGRHAYYAIDGDAKTDWRSEPTAAAAALTVDLGEAKWLGAVRLAWGWRYSPAAWRLSASVDGVTWVEVHSRDDAQSETCEPSACEAEEGAGDGECAAPASAAGSCEPSSWVSCGHHTASRCEECPRCGDFWCGAPFCADECVWREGACHAAPPAAGARVERATVASAQCVAALSALPTPARPPPPVLPNASAANATANATDNATANATANGTAGGGVLAACIAARWVRLECLSKRPGVDDEPYVLKELALLPLSSLAPFVDPASRRADEGARRAVGALGGDALAATVAGVARRAQTERGRRGARAPARVAPWELHV